MTERAGIDRREYGRWEATDILMANTVPSKLETQTICASSMNPPMPDSPRPDAAGVRVPDDRREEAVERLVAEGPPAPNQARRFLAFAADQQVDLRGIWASEDPATGQYRAATLIVPNPGRAAMVFATRVRESTEIPEVAGLIDHAARAIESEGPPLGDLQLLQVLTDPGEDLERRVFRAAGFVELATLRYLERSIPGLRGVPKPTWPGDVSLRTYSPEDRDTLIEILDASYQDTLDCPGLLGMRNTHDILAGHISTGRFDPAFWTMLFVNERPAGCILVNRATRAHGAELVYLGLARFARGRTLGTALLQHAMQQLHAVGVRTLSLAVDEDNAPALHIYGSLGFRPILRRLALVRTVRSSTGLRSCPPNADSVSRAGE